MIDFNKLAKEIMDICNGELDVNIEDNIISILREVHEDGAKESLHRVIETLKGENINA